MRRCAGPAPATTNHEQPPANAHVGAGAPPARGRCGLGLGWGSRPGRVLTRLRRSLNSGHAVDGVERDPLGDSVTARAWMLERSISPTYSEWMALIETRSTLPAVLRGERSPAALERLLSAMTSGGQVAVAGPVWRQQRKGRQWQDGVADGAVRAILAWNALRRSHPGRLRACSDAQCQLFVLDLYRAAPADSDRGRAQIWSWRAPRESP